GGRVQVAQAVEDEAERLGGVQVVVHRGGELLEEGREVPGERARRRLRRGGVGGQLVGTGEGLVETLERTRRLLQTTRREVERRPVVRAEEEEPQGLARRAFRRLGDAEDVAQRLRHLVAAEGDHAVVHPEVRERGAGGRLRLCD